MLYNHAPLAPEIAKVCLSFDCFMECNPSEGFLISLFLVTNSEECIELKHTPEKEHWLHLFPSLFTP